MGFRSEMLQVCKKCKGTGTSTKEARDNDGNIMLAPVYNKKDGDRPAFENCKECNGLGRAMYESPKEVFEDGNKIPLDADSRRARWQDALAT